MAAALDVTNFVDDAWLSQNGTFHGDAMHLIEKLTREATVIFGEITIEDPKAFTRPWQFSRHLIHGLEGGHALVEAPGVEHDGSHLVTTIGTNKP